MPLEHVSPPLHVQGPELAEEQAAELALDEQRELASLVS
jgi:hypothetical protein